MELYTSDGCHYTGMSEATVTTLRTELGRSTTFVTQAVYNAYIAAQQS